jgi:hypothetical protein
MPQGSFGQIKAFHDFTNPASDVAWPAGTGDLPGGTGWGFVSVNEGSIAEVVDESGGVWKFTTDTGDNDNICLLAGPFDPSKGSVTVEARLKIADSITLGAVFVGLSETMALGTPVMPAEFATATMTYNGSGGMLGLVWDPDATTNAWKAACGDGGAVSGSAQYGANGTNATEAMVLNEYDIVRVVLNAGGNGEVWHDEELVASGATGLTTTDLFYAVVMLENRSAAAEELELDYVYASGVRDWAV